MGGVYRIQTLFEFLYLQGPLLIPSTLLLSIFLVTFQGLFVSLDGKLSCATRMLL